MGQASIDGRSGRPRRTATAHVRATQPNCHLCGYLIDLSLPRTGRTPHPLSSTIDELVPVKHGGSITDPTNLAHAHRICNGSRGTKPITPEVRTRCRTLVESLMVTHTETTYDW